MKRSLKLKITTIRRETATMRVATLILHCRACGCEVETVSKCQAMRILGVEETGLEVLTAAGRVHAVLTVNGNRWVCKRLTVSKIERSDYDERL